MGYLYSQWGQSNFWSRISISWDIFKAFRLGKVQILLEGHKIWKNLPFCFEILCKIKTKWEIFFKFLWPPRNTWTLIYTTTRNPQIFFLEIVNLKKPVATSKKQCPIMVSCSPEARQCSLGEDSERLLLRPFLQGQRIKTK